MYELTPQDLTIYLEYLAEFYAPATVPVYFSHARTYMELCSHPVHMFDHRLVTKALTSIANNKAHRDIGTIPLSIYQFNLVLSCIPQSPNLVTYLCAFTLLLVCAWRRSNIAPDTMAGYDQHRHLSRGDFTITNSALHIHQKWAKNMQRAGHTHDIIINSDPNNRYCVVALLAAMLNQVPTTSYQEPLLVFPDTRKVITTSHLGRVWGKAVAKAGLPPKLHTLHCIRKTAATLAADLGASERQLMELGLWRSSSYQKYVRTRRSTPLQTAIASHVTKI